MSRKPTENQTCIPVFDQAAGPWTEVPVALMDGGEGPGGRGLLARHWHCLSSLSFPVGVGRLQSRALKVAPGATAALGSPASALLAVALGVFGSLQLPCSWRWAGSCTAEALALTAVLLASERSTTRGTACSVIVSLPGCPLLMEFRCARTLRGPQVGCVLFRPLGFAHAVPSAWTRLHL